MAGDKTIVVTGYGPWAKTAVNPAAQVIEAISETRWDGYRLVPLVVPVQTEGLFRLVETALQAHRPAIWIGFGVAPDATAIRAEIAGINCRAFDVPDNDGVTLEGAPIVEPGEAAYLSTFPARDIVKHLKAAGIPAEVSYSAGTHLCNQMLYTFAASDQARHDLATLLRLSFMCHIHRSSWPACSKVRKKLPPSMSLSLMIAAAKIAVELHGIAQIEEGRLAGRRSVTR